jgi:hypothetical protein
VWTELVWLRVGTSGGFCYCGTGLFGFIKCLEFLSDCTIGGLLSSVKLHRVS